MVGRFICRHHGLTIHNFIIIYYTCDVSKNGIFGLKRDRKRFERAKTVRRALKKRRWIFRVFFVQLNAHTARQTWIRIVEGRVLILEGDSATWWFGRAKARREINLAFFKRGELRCCCCGEVSTTGVCVVVLTTLLLWYRTIAFCSAWSLFVGRRRLLFLTFFSTSLRTLDHYAQGLEAAALISVSWCQLKKFVTAICRIGFIINTVFFLLFWLWIVGDDSTRSLASFFGGGGGYYLHVLRFNVCVELCLLCLFLDSIF